MINYVKVQDIKGEILAFIQKKHSSEVLPIHDTCLKKLFQHIFKTYKEGDDVHSHTYISLVLGLQIPDDAVEVKFMEDPHGNLSLQKYLIIK
jgi:hypothetical protein